MEDVLNRAKLKIHNFSIVIESLLLVSYLISNVDSVEKVVKENEKIVELLHEFIDYYAVTN